QIAGYGEHQAAGMDHAKLLVGRFDAQALFRFGTRYAGPVFNDVILAFERAGTGVEVQADGPDALAGIAVRGELRHYRLVAVQKAEMVHVLDRIRQRHNSAYGVTEPADAGGFGDAENDAMRA